MVEDPPIKLIHVTTVPQTLAFLSGQVGYMQDLGYEVGAISSPGPLLRRFGDAERIAVHPIAMARRISPLRDMVSLARLWRKLVVIHPQIVHTHTPKAGLLGTLAAWLARVPVRIYHIHGLPLMTARGLKRALLWRVEWTACRLAGQVYCVSHSLREVVVTAGLCPPEKIKVLLGGSINGVDAEGQFDPGRHGALERQRVRDRHGIPHDALVVGYVGRIVADKGLAELVAAWTRLRAEFPTLALLVVGPFESADPVPAEVAVALRNADGCHLVGEVADPAPCYAAMDLLVLPSHREGLGYTLIEAGAMMLPVVATRIPGCVDAVDDGRTGTLVPPRDVDALCAAIRRYLGDAPLRRAHGTAGRQRVLQMFRREAIWEAMAGEYARLLQARAAAPRRRVSRSLKRLLDVAVAASALVVLSPLLLVLALAIRRSMGAPVIFRQVRPGRAGKRFVLVKFRTMREASGPDGTPLPDAARLTRLGRWLRGSSLDELPQLWNVLKGEMSLVGPRPLLPEYLPLYTPEQARRHEVRPGITGWAQVNGRNALSWEEKFAHDVWYVDHWSLALDLKILAMTVLKVVRREGITAAGEATIRPFSGPRSTWEVT